MSDATTFDHYLSDDGPAALVIREWLMPVEGNDGVLFPATFAPEQGTAPERFPGGYNIDRFPNGTNVCLIDSIGSQANRIEPLFAGEKYRHLVPQIGVQVTEEKTVSLLEAGHRAGDAIIRCSSLQDEIEGAFRASLKGDAEPLAKIAPTSLVFGVWNSRGGKAAQERRPRLIASSIRAFNVRRLTRHAQYNPAVRYMNEGLLDGIDATEDELAQKGYVDQPIGKQPDPKKPDPTHGGVIADGGIRRDATLGLAALRLLFAGKDEKQTLALRRYILGLALVAFTYNTYKPGGYLRQGCLLVLDPDRAKENEFAEVYPNGDRKPVAITHGDALQYATDAAAAFGVGESKTVPFEKERAKRDVKGEGEGKKKGGKGKNKEIETAPPPREVQE